MENLWLKIKIWTKIILFSIVVIYLALFIFKNADQELTIWVWPYPYKEFRTTALQLIPAMLLAGVFGTLVIRMAFRAFKQIGELKKRNAAARMQKDMADIRAKAAMLQTKPQTADAANQSK